MATENERVPLSTGVSQPSTSMGAVFLSYASEDAGAAQRIANALRDAGIEVWFDREELRGGDSWDRKIRQQIHDCRLFIAVISAHTEARDEGYFRREWRLAVERAGDMAEDKAFVVPVAIDGTSERIARVPDSFKQVQWTRLLGGETPPAFVERVRRLLSPVESTSTRVPASGESGAVSGIRMQAPASGWSRHILPLAATVVVLGAFAYLAIDRPWNSKRPTATRTAASAAPAAFNPPPHSIAVLPFVNMSGDKEQEYFSDGLAEELLNDLSRINELQVAARTSAFSFKGKDTDIGTIAKKLNVGAVLEGSVRRSARTVRVTAQLINAVTGFHMWSQTYDRNVGDLLKMQGEIAEAVAGALKVTLLGDLATKIQVGGTRNAAAFDAYLRATKTYLDGHYEAAIAGYTEAIRIDADYALAYAARSTVILDSSGNASTPSAVRASIEKSLSDARMAIALAPDLAEGHIALGGVYYWLLDFRAANEQFERALALAPGNVRVLQNYGSAAIVMGDGDSGLVALRRAVALDPLDVEAHVSLAVGLYALRRAPEAIAACNNAEVLKPGRCSLAIGLSYYQLGNFETARVSCEKDKEDQFLALRQICLAIAYDKLGRHADAETMLAQLRARERDTGALDYSEVYAQWGNIPRALDSLEMAMRLRLPDLLKVKSDPRLDPLRNEPRFQAIERALKFPD